MDILSVNIIYDNLLIPVVLYVKQRMIVDDYIKQSVATDYFTIAKSHYETNNGFKILNRDTHFCEVCEKCKDGSTYWVAMKYIKVSHPL